MLNLEHRLRTKPQKDDKDIRDKIVNLLNNKEKCWFNICILANKIYKDNLYKKWKSPNGNLYEKVEDYAKTELGLEYRVFMWYVRMGKAIEEFGIKESDIKDTDWTKFKELCKILKDIKKEEIPYYLDFIKAKSFKEVKEFVTDYQIKKYGREFETVYRITFKLLEEQYKIYKEAINLAKENFEVTDDAMAIEAIMTFYLVNHDKVGIIC